VSCLRGGVIKCYTARNQNPFINTPFFHVFFFFTVEALLNTGSEVWAVWRVRFSTGKCPLYGRQERLLGFSGVIGVSYIFVAFVVYV